MAKSTPGHKMLQSALLDVEMETIDAQVARIPLASKNSWVRAALHRAGKQFAQMTPEAVAQEIAALRDVPPADRFH